MSSFWTAALTIAVKDMKIEWRTKTAFASAIVFAVLVLAVFYFARDPTAVGALDIAPGALWVTFTFAAMLGLNRAFLLESENRAMDGLLLAPIAPSAIFVGKFLGNLAFVGVVELVSLPLFILFYDLPIIRQLPALVGVIAMATIAFVAVGTLLSAMVVRTRFAELMLPILLLPFLIPPVVGAVQLTSRILSQRPLSDLAGWLKLLASFDIIFVILCFFLFEATLEE
ncbi:MAG: heme exporter protein CcmB [Gemmatimonadota bacterium]|nr:MAG: heme exporter protein CcmB [Gemmatimonadota bacterium]